MMQALTFGVRTPESMLIDSAEVASELDRSNLAGAAEMARVSGSRTRPAPRRAHGGMPASQSQSSMPAVPVRDRETGTTPSAGMAERTSTTVGNGIAPRFRAGGANSSHTILLAPLSRLLESVDCQADVDAYERAVVDDNLLGKATVESRRRTLRYLKELYLLRRDSILFRALRDLWTDDAAGQPLLAGLCALARDPLFRASAPAIMGAEPGDTITSADLAGSVDAAFPGRYNEATLAKIGRNTFSSWQQSGHLKTVVRTRKIRQRATCTPATAAYALLIGHLDGVAGAALFETVWAEALDGSHSHLTDLATTASQRLLIDFRHSGGITEVGFSELLRPFEGQLE